MSLINDALKKAQKQRTGEAPADYRAMPAIGGESATRISERAKPSGNNSLFLKLGLGAGGLIVLVVAGVFFLRSSHNPPSPPATVVQPVANTPTPPPAAPPVMAASTPVVTEPSVNFVLPVAPAPAPKAAPKAEPKTVVAAPVETPTPAAAEKPAGPPAKIDSKGINYIEGLHVAGIRASGNDSKVLMNDRVYRVGDIVEHDLDLKLVGITASSLTFEDDNGARYTRNF